MPYKNSVLLMGHVHGISEKNGYIKLCLRTKSNYKPKDGGEARDVFIELEGSAKYWEKLLELNPNALLYVEAELSSREYEGKNYMGLKLQRVETLWNTKPKQEQRQEPQAPKCQPEDRPPQVEDIKDIPDDDIPF